MAIIFFGLLVYVIKRPGGVMYKEIFKEIFFGCAVYMFGLAVTVGTIAYVFYEGR